MAEPRELSLDLPAVHRGVSVARSLARRFARLEGLEQRDADTLLLVLSELLANAVDHGGGEAALSEETWNGHVRMRASVRLGDAGWSVTVTDQGGGDPDALRDLLAAGEEPDLEDERGRGIYLIRRLTDELAIERSPDGRGLEIVATRRYETG